jgi:hypothetical protein
MHILVLAVNNCRPASGIFNHAGRYTIEVMSMSAAFLPIHDVIMEKLNTPDRQDGYRALDLINELDASYQESDVQKELAHLLSDGIVILTLDRKLKLK